MTVKEHRLTPAKQKTLPVGSEVFEVKKKVGSEPYMSTPMPPILLTSPFGVGMVAARPEDGA